MAKLKIKSYARNPVQALCLMLQGAIMANVSGRLRTAFPSSQNIIIPIIPVSSHIIYCAERWLYSIGNKIKLLYIL